MGTTVKRPLTSEAMRSAIEQAVTTEQACRLRQACDRLETLEGFDNSEQARKQARIRAIREAEQSVASRSRQIEAELVNSVHMYGQAELTVAIRRAVDNALSEHFEAIWSRLQARIRARLTEGGIPVYSRPRGERKTTDTPLSLISDRQVSETRRAADCRYVDEQEVLSCALAHVTEAWRGVYLGVEQPQDAILLTVRQACRRALRGSEIWMKAGAQKQRSRDRSKKNKLRTPSEIAESSLPTSERDTIGPLESKPARIDRERFDAIDMLWMLRRRLTRAKDGERLLVVLDGALDGLSLRQIGARCGFSHETARKRWERVKELATKLASGQELDLVSDEPPVSAELRDAIEARNETAAELAEVQERITSVPRPYNGAFTKPYRSIATVKRNDGQEGFPLGGRAKPILVKVRREWRTSGHIRAGIGGAPSLESGQHVEVPEYQSAKRVESDRPALTSFGIANKYRQPPVHPIVARIERLTGIRRPRVDHGYNRIESTKPIDCWPNTYRKTRIVRVRLFGHRSSYLTPAE